MRRGVRERFVSDRLPAPASPNDYDSAGHVKLGAEYSEWLATAENSLRQQTALVSSGGELRVTSPIPGGTYLLDPDIPSSARIPLAAAGGGQLVWTSDSLHCESDGALYFAVGADGEHRITVTDSISGAKAEVQINVRSL